MNETIFAADFAGQRVTKQWPKPEAVQGMHGFAGWAVKNATEPSGTQPILMVALANKTATPETSMMNSRKLAKIIDVQANHIEVAERG
jgi:hypothetical protein